MHLLWLIDSLTVGGAESLVLSFARRFDRKRHQLTVVTLTTIQGNALEEDLRREGVEVVNLGSRNLRDLRAFRRLLALVRERKFDLIHAHLTYAAIWGSLLARLTGIPCVASLHVAPPRDGTDRVKDRLMRFVLDRWAARVITVSAALRDRYLAVGGIAAEKFVVVHNGIEVGRFTPSAEPSRSIVTVSVLRPGKGIEVLLEAARLVSDGRFVIVGDGPMRNAWRARAAELGVTKRVEWAGYRSDVHTVLPRHGFFVLPSLDDAFPTVLLEAMATGLPVIASRVGGIPEIVEEGVTGVLVPPGDAAALARAISAMLQNDPESMRTAARARAKKEFSTEAWIARLEKIYAEVVR